MSARQDNAGRMAHSTRARRQQANSQRDRAPERRATLTLSSPSAQVAPSDSPVDESVSPSAAGSSARPSAGQMLANVGPWLRGLTVEHWAWVAVLVVAIALRFWDLGAKPLHHDESMHAYYSLMFARDPSTYAYNPLLHGPFQFHAVGFMFSLILAAQTMFHVGALGNNPWINDATARIVPALFGVGIVALPLGLRREMGRWGALAAAVLLAVSPSFVYFSRFLREDIYFNFFMFAMVVCAVRFAASRKMIWLALTAASITLAYATFEGVFITFAIFGAFLAGLIAWELGRPIGRMLLPTPASGGRSTVADDANGEGKVAQTDAQGAHERRQLWTGRGVALLALAAIGAGIAAYALHTMKSLGAYIQTHTTQADVQVALLEQQTVVVLLYVSIGLAAFVILALLWQITRENALYVRREREALAANADDEDEQDEPASMSGVERLDSILSAPGRAMRSLRQRTDPVSQPLLRLLLGVPWTQWFVAFVVAWMLFAGLYWEFPTVGRSLGQGFVDGIGKGVWQGLYYWMQQQNVARGGQPIYYYLMLIPMYEQLAVVFGLAGVVYALVRPTRFRLFLVWWFFASLAIYSWAGEKMPWLSIHILLALMLLAGIMLAVTVLHAVAAARTLLASRSALTWQSGGALASTLLAALLLVVMVHSMYLLVYKDPANAPLEMMVYVQTTPDVDTVMAKINQADQKLNGGRHQLNVVVGTGEEWPMYWYLRDYWMDPHPGSYVTWDPSSFQNMHPDVLILYPGADVQAFFAAHPTGYHQKEYALRSWFDEGYKPQLACQQHPGTTCPANVDYSLYGNGLGRFLSYGANPPAKATFNLGRAAPRVLNWLWNRQPLGATQGPYYDFVFIVRDGIGVQP